MRAARRAPNEARTPAPRAAAEQPLPPSLAIGLIDRTAGHLDPQPAVAAALDAVHATTADLRHRVDRGEQELDRAGAGDPGDLVDRFREPALRLRGRPATVRECREFLEIREHERRAAEFARNRRERSADPFAKPFGFSAASLHLDPSVVQLEQALGKRRCAARPEGGDRRGVRQATDEIRCGGGIGRVVRAASQDRRHVRGIDFGRVGGELRQRQAHDRVGVGEMRVAIERPLRERLRLDADLGEARQEPPAQGLGALGASPKRRSFGTIGEILHEAIDAPRRRAVDRTRRRRWLASRRGRCGEVRHERRGERDRAQRRAPPSFPPAERAARRVFKSGSASHAR